jgi:tetratricopeptide (TPR) repeat protein
MLPGHAILARTLGNLFITTGDEAIAREGRTHAQRALALDGSNPIVLTSVAIGLGFLGAWREAMGHAQRAVDLNPNIALCHVNLALACLHFNRPDDAIAHLEAAAILAPRGYQTNLALGYKGLAHFQAGRYELALQAVEEALLLHPNIFMLKDKAVVCEKLGRHEDAGDAIRHLRAAEPSLTLDDIERANTIVFAPETANEMNATLCKVWLETPLECET